MYWNKTIRLTSANEVRFDCISYFNLPVPDPFVTFAKYGFQL